MFVIPKMLGYDTKTKSDANILFMLLLLHKEMYYLVSKTEKVFFFSDEYKRSCIRNNQTLKRQDVTEKGVTAKRHSFLSVDSAFNKIHSVDPFIWFLLFIALQIYSSWFKMCSVTDLLDRNPEISLAMLAGKNVKWKPWGFFLPVPVWCQAMPFNMESSEV